MLDPQIHIYIVSTVFESRIVFIKDTIIFELHTKYTVNSWKFKPDSADGS